MPSVVAFSSSICATINAAASAWWTAPNHMSSRCCLLSASMPCRAGLKCSTASVGEPASRQYSAAHSAILYPNRLAHREAFIFSLTFASLAVLRRGMVVSFPARPRATVQWKLAKSSEPRLLSALRSIMLCIEWPFSRRRSGRMRTRRLTLCGLRVRVCRALSCSSLTSNARQRQTVSWPWSAATFCMRASMALNMLAMSGVDGQWQMPTAARTRRCAGGARHVLNGARAHLDVVLMIEAKHGTSGKRCVLPQPLHAEISRPALQPLLQCCARGDPVPTRRVARAVHEPQIVHSPVGQNSLGVEHGARAGRGERRVGSHFWSGCNRSYLGSVRTQDGHAVGALKRF